MLHLKILENNNKQHPKRLDGKDSSESELKLIKKKWKKSRRVNKRKSWVFEDSNRIDKSLAKLTKRQPGRTQVNKIRKEKGAITTYSEKIQRIITDYF